MSNIEHKYLKVILRNIRCATFISMRFFDKVFFDGCEETSAAMLNLA